MPTLETFHQDDEGRTLVFDTFDDAAAVAQQLIVPEIANAIDDAVADGGRGMKGRVCELTAILAKICSPDPTIVIDAIDDWGFLAQGQGIGETWVRLNL